VPILARTPREVFQTVQDHFNHTLNTILTHYRLEFTVRHAKQMRTLLHFEDSQNEAVAVSLPSSVWRLYLSFGLQAVPEGRNYSLHVLQYAHRIQRTSSIDDEAEVRFEYVSPAIDPKFSYSRHHVQFHHDSRSASSDFSLSKLHIPTGGVTIEHVIRFLIADLGVPPLAEHWQEELRASERVTREWLRDAE
jgi:hypothetical protein